MISIYVISNNCNAPGRFFFALGSITKSHSNRLWCGFRVPIIKRAPFEKLSLHINHKSTFFEKLLITLFRFSDDSPTSRDYTLPTGDFNKGNNRMNSSKRFTLQYIGFYPCCCSDVGAVWQC